MGDILDQQLVDRNGHNMGRVDGIVLELRGDEPPRISALLVGGHLVARRLHRRLQPWALRLSRFVPGADVPFRIPWSKVKKIGVDVKVDVEAEQAVPWEHWLRERLISRIPGA